MASVAQVAKNRQLRARNLKTAASRFKNRVSTLPVGRSTKSARDVVAPINLKVSLRRYITGHLTEATCYVIFSALVGRVDEHLAVAAKLDQIPKFMKGG